jgi:hypothetical protein
VVKRIVFSLKNQLVAQGALETNLARQGPLYEAPASCEIILNLSDLVKYIIE